MLAAPEARLVDSGCCAPSHLLAKDFSAYYTGAWRLLHNPSQVYTHGLVNDGEYPVLPVPEQYKYLPSFLILVSPLLALPYQTALYAFDILQFALLPMIAFLVFQLFRKTGTTVTLLVATVILLLPMPLSPQWGASASYYWQWAEGQSKVLETFLLLLSLYLGKSGRPRLSGLTFAVAAFDPRFALLGLPLFLLYNRGSRSASASAMGAFALLNAPLLYPPTFQGFVGMVFTTGLVTFPAFYTLIPLVALGSLLLVEGAELRLAAERSLMRAWRSWTRRGSPGPRFHG